MWFAGRLPDKSGIPWSTNWKYSRDSYLKNDCTVQIEVSVGNMSKRLNDAGVLAKFEGDGQTWGLGPKSEQGDKKSKKFILNNRKDVGRIVLRAIFKDVMPKARVVARVLNHPA